MEKRYYVSFTMYIQLKKKTTTRILLAVKRGVGLGGGVFPKCLDSVCLKQKSFSYIVQNKVVVLNISECS